MNTPFLGLRVGSVIIGLVGLCHLLRLLTETSIVVGGVSIPLWVSAVAVLVSGGLCAWLWRLSIPLKPVHLPAQESHTGHPTPV